MALIGPFETVEGVKLDAAYYQPQLTGGLGRALLTVNVYASKRAQRDGRQPLVQKPIGWVEIDPAQPVAPQIYPIVKARLPGLADDI